jgi:hypothetical protein
MIFLDEDVASMFNLAGPYVVERDIGLGDCPYYPPKKEDFGLSPTVPLLSLFKSKSDYLSLKAKADSATFLVCLIPSFPLAVILGTVYMLAFCSIN